MRIITAWQHTLPEVIVRGFRKCCISNGMDGADDNISTFIEHTIMQQQQHHQQFTVVTSFSLPFRPYVM
jgi:hypothetical protein